ncbi:GTP-binding protein HflX [Ereboglobus sp. PH5-5]|uniref:GTPase HflX n=1 Tax=Ereboglobus sp. PH5-5 TaxID=2940529 RepID=UPI002406DA80|nr:GTPase HflX [Ereboglobus sp. PH5-5]MDF9834255.1 GTP-binding protein HflX [Ereboglobus sp. PH5-5]
MADFLTATPSTDDSKKCERAFLVGVQTPGMKPGEARELLDELRELVENLGIGVVSEELVNLRAPNAATLLGSGKTHAVIASARAAHADLIVIDEPLSPAQQRNWEKESGVAVIDREEVILDIFAERASTREAVLQVALARMEYSLPRLTRAWTHLSRQRGRGKLGGEGETQLEQDRRIVRDRITHLRLELSKVVSQRDVQRHRRMRVPVPTASIVGYTNAGKSTLINRLTGAQVLAENKLFATLDPTTRQLVLPNNQKLLVTDTVGFIRRLPHRLVEAFKATLEEVIVSDFLIHVIDVSNPDFEKHHATTLAVLDELGAADKTIVTVFNKTDLADDTARAHALALAPDACFVSAATGENVDVLLARCAGLIADQYASARLYIPHARYDLVAKLHKLGHVQHEEQFDTGVYVEGRIPPALAAAYESFAVAKKPAGKRRKR